MAFQAVFAIITVALISGAIADRAKFAAWTIFTVVWATVVYFPVADWVFAFDGFAADKGGWIANQLKAIDFAGGTAVHINAGAAGLALALVLGKRVGFGKEPMRPHNLTLVMLGAGLLWFGWFGFNAGSALGANGTAAIAWVNTLAATGAAMLGWLVVEKMRDGTHDAGRRVRCGRRPRRHHPRLPPVTPVGAVVLGILAGAACALRGWPEVPPRLRRQPGRRGRPPRRRPGRHHRHGLPGARASAPAGVDGLFYGGGVDQLWRQTVGALAVLAFSFIATYVIGLALEKTIGFRLEREAEIAGIDLQEHAETGTTWVATPAGASAAPRPEPGVIEPDH